MSGEGEIVSESVPSEDLVPGNGNDKSLQQIITGVVENLMTEKFADFKNEINDSVQATINKSLAEFRAQDTPARQESVLHSREENVHPKTDVAGTSPKDKQSYLRQSADDELQSTTTMTGGKEIGSGDLNAADAERGSDRSSQELAEQDVNPESLLTKKLKDMKHELMQELRTEMQTVIYETLHGYRVEGKIIDNGSGEQTDNESDDNLDMEKGTSEADTTVEKIQFWRKMAKDENKSARETDLRSSFGIHTVICLDTSESMKDPKAWTHARQFYMEYLNGLQLLSDDDKTLDKVALVVFGKVTKVCRRFTTDFDGLKAEFDNLKPDGPSPMFGGLVLSKAVAETSDKRYPNADVEIWPKIILITDGRPTDVNNIDGAEASVADNSPKTKRLIYNEVKRLKDARIELHIVYVGAADFEFLHMLRECIDGSMLPYTDGEKMAHCHLIKIIAKRITESKKRKTAGGSEDEKKSALDEILQPLRESMEEDLKKLVELKVELKEHMENLLKERKHDMYKMSDDKRYPRIGERVRRGRNWNWGDQDGNGVGTIVGHHLKDAEERKQLWVWVEWDENEDINVYRYQHGSGMKSDVKIVQEERLPPENGLIAVGMKVGPGKDFEEDKPQPCQGVVIRLIVSSDSDARSKAEVMWTDGTRGQYYFGEGGTKVEIEPRTVFGKPDKPRNLEIVSVSDKAVRLKWEKPANSGGCSILKYSVFRKTDNENSDWLQTVDVDGSQTSATVSVLLPKENYKFAVRAENKEGFGMLTETKEPFTLELKVNRPQPPAGPVRFSKITKSSCTMSWKERQAFQESTVAPVSRYILEYRPANDRWNSIDVGLATTYKICNLKKSTRYEVQVKAVNESGESEPLEMHTFYTMTLLDDDIPDAELHPKDIAELSQGIGNTWPILGAYFDRTNVEIQRIKEDNNLSVAMQINTMLLSWKADRGADATMHKFLEIIEKFKATVNVDWPIIEQVTRRFQNEA
ncbi:uncharacterized protein LOC128550572 [Mercenaria mercenaria]|uniref:uncharacterized protein LOC128550572 n=1 Tax=Mercenaria mercenaria TaxID=6596 RepID=UPI00234F096E|nr:uncharacterized protein LOC128550572 [Mercenaria mercenaria]